MERRTIHDVDLVDEAIRTFASDIAKAGLSVRDLEMEWEKLGYALVVRAMIERGHNQGIPREGFTFMGVRHYLKKP